MYIRLFRTKRSLTNVSIRGKSHKLAQPQPQAEISDQEKKANSLWLWEHTGLGDQEVVNSFLQTTLQLFEEEIKKKEKDIECYKTITKNLGNIIKDNEEKISQLGETCILQAKIIMAQEKIIKQDAHE